MKNARPIKDESGATDQGAAIFACGKLPKRHNTVTAEVLCRLLNHERLTGLEAVFDASTTRLADVVYRLHGTHNWMVSVEEKVVGTADGRTVTIAEYFILPEIIETAMAAGAAVWCAEVRTARAALRAKAAEAERKAARINAARRTARAHPGQFGLFDAGAS